MYMDLLSTYILGYYDWTLRLFVVNVWVGTPFALKVAPFADACDSKITEEVEANIVIRQSFEQCTQSVQHVARMIDYQVRTWSLTSQDLCFNKHASSFTVALQTPKCHIYYIHDVLWESVCVFACVLYVCLLGYAWIFRNLAVCDVLLNSTRVEQIERNKSTRQRHWGSLASTFSRTKKIGFDPKIHSHLPDVLFFSAAHLWVFSKTVRVLIYCQLIYCRQTVNWAHASQRILLGYRRIFSPIPYLHCGSDLRAPFLSTSSCDFF